MTCAVALLPRIFLRSRMHAGFTEQETCSLLLTLICFVASGLTMHWSVCIYLSLASYLDILLQAYLIKWLYTRLPFDAQIPRVYHCIHLTYDLSEEIALKGLDSTQHWHMRAVT